VCVSVVSTGGSIAQDEQTESLRQAQKAFTNSIQPILDRTCGDCHFGDDSDAGLNLESVENIEQVLNDRTEWQKILNRVSKKQMPPKGAEPELDDVDREKLTQWIDNLINNLDCSKTSPGRITIRRLNATEYRNTIRDLTGVDYAAAQEFPGDDVGYGFDHIGDVLSLPPILMEKYLDAAESILDQAIMDLSKSKIDQTIFAAELDDINGSYSVNDEFRVLTMNGTLTRRMSFPAKGTYTVELEAYGDHAGDEWPELVMTLDSQQKQKVEVEARSRRPSDHSFTFRVREPGKKRLEFSFTNDYFDEDFPLRTARDRNLYLGQIKIKGPSQQRIKTTESHQKIVIAAPSEDLSADQAASRVIYSFASRAFRRKANREDVAKIKSLFDSAIADGDSYEQALKFALQAVLVSPNFLYKVESPPPADGQAHDLQTFELATSLSYYLWSSMPDDELFRVAAESRLSQPQEYRNQIRRLLANPRSSSLVENFAEQWLQLRVLNETEPDPDLFPTADQQLLEDMATETRMMFADLLRRDASVLEMLEADYTFLNERLARHYGIRGIRGDRFQRVDTRQLGRGGILTHGSVLTLTSNPDRTSPVKRGKWIMENLLGEEPPPALPDAAPLKDQAELGGTLRERMEQHRKDPNCASCHQKMDQLGFALENFDAVGRWRENDGKLPIDASAELPDGLKFTGAGGLQKTLSGKLKRQFLTCFTEKMLIYALGRGLTYSDQCAVDAIIEKASRNDYRISEFIIAVAESEPFMKRSLRKNQ
jgi:mono/diheme cytochrome c family protein